MRLRFAVGFWAGLVLSALPAGISAQQQHHHEATDGTARWHWHADAGVFFGLNHQDRKFRDFTVWESQNWLMAGGERDIRGKRLRLKGMVSLEAFTLQAIGSPQAFQTGETYQGGALIDYQHPHDLVMGLGADLRVPVGAVALVAGADLVGSPTLGPPVFMHRASAAFNPQAPLAHHHLDATHITPGVVRGGLEISAWTIEGSWFRGREPDEDRLDLDLGALDSYAIRVVWMDGPWSAQASSGWLTEPELVTPFDATRLTASLSYTGGRLAWMAAFGQNREIHGNLEAYLVEATWRKTPRDAFYARVESVAKDILDVGFHPVGTFHRHRQSQVTAATVGYVRNLVQNRFGAFGVGGDLTGYIVPSNLREAYGSSPVSGPRLFALSRAPEHVARSLMAGHVKAWRLSISANRLRSASERQSARRGACQRSRPRCIRSSLLRPAGGLAVVCPRVDAPHVIAANDPMGRDPGRLVGPALYGQHW